MLRLAAWPVFDVFGVDCAAYVGFFFAFGPRQMMFCGMCVGTAFLLLLSDRTG